ncbi:MAG: STAS domain-containing protein, partial [Erysipelotrichaceae bacterium]|nr:STAS domain-containing protein [Erysipelotrichaceae bacterium]
SAPDLETIFNEISESDVKELQLDFKGLDYISSAGLRVLLRGQRMMSEKGGMVITNVKDTVMEVFEMTGFIDILTIK